MKLLTFALVGILFIECQNKKTKLAGHYRSVPAGQNSYEYQTIDVSDSLVLIDRDLILFSLRDTMVINPDTHTFVRQTRELFPFYDFGTSGDTLLLMFSHDAGIETIKFLSAPPTFSDRFSTLVVEIKPDELLGEKEVKVNESKISHLLIGYLKKEVNWANKDSIYLVFDGEVTLAEKDFDQLGKELQANQKLLCLSFDKTVPSTFANRIRQKITKSIREESLIELRRKGDKLVFISIQV
jgi:hypothetical protein